MMHGPMHVRFTYSYVLILYTQLKSVEVLNIYI